MQLLNALFLSMLPPCPSMWLWTLNNYAAMVVFLLYKYFFIKLQPDELGNQLKKMGYAVRYRDSRRSDQSHKYIKELGT